MSVFAKCCLQCIKCAMGFQGTICQVIDTEQVAGVRRGKGQSEKLWKRHMWAVSRLSRLLLSARSTQCPRKDEGRAAAEGDILKVRTGPQSPGDVGLRFQNELQTS